MKLSEINPHVRYAATHRKLPSASAFSRNYDCRLFFIMSGTASIFTNGTEYKLSNNDVLFLPPCSRYRFAPSFGDAELCSINFDLVCDYSDIERSLGTASDGDFDERRAPRYALPSELSSPLFAHSPEMRELLVRCCSEFLHGAEHFRMAASALIKLCITMMARESAYTAPRAESRIAADVTKYIRDNFADPALTNTTIAEHFGYHPYYLSGLMKRASGKTLHKYLTDYRLLIAKNYLCATDLDISVVAWKCGFGSAAYFTKQFRESFGEAPLTYRKAHSPLP